MKRHFYSDLVNSEALLLELDDLDLDKFEKDDLKEMIDKNLHHAILEAVLDELSEDDKRIFLDHIAHDNHDEVWKHLRSRIYNIEGKIRTTADSLMEDLYKDIKSVKEEEALES